MSDNGIQVSPEVVIASLSRQIGQQAQRIAMLEALLDATSQDQNNDLDSGNG
jgi:hypothetical protein